MAKVRKVSPVAVKTVRLKKALSGMSMLAKPYQGPKQPAWANAVVKAAKGKKADWTGGVAENSSRIGQSADPVLIGEPSQLITKKTRPTVIPDLHAVAEDLLRKHDYQNAGRLCSIIEKLTTAACK